MNVRQSGLTWFTAFLFCILPAVARAEDDLGVRVLYDSAQLPAASWKSSEGVVVSSSKTGVSLTNGGADYGWAVADRVVSIRQFPECTLELYGAAAGKGSLMVQLEAFNEEARFMYAKKLVEVRADAGKTEDKTVKPVALLKAVKIKKRMVTPLYFKVKYWLEGPGSTGTVERVLVTAPRRWTNPQTQLVRAWPDEAGTTLAVTDTSGGGAAERRADEPASFYDRGVVIADILDLQGGTVTLAAVCLDEQGKEIGTVHLAGFKTALMTEVSFATLKAPWPAGTRKLAFRWRLEGKDATATIGGLFYGLEP